MNAIAMVATAPLAAFVTDTENTILAWNDKAAALLGHTEAGAIGERCYLLLRATDVFGNRFCSRRCPLVEMALRHEASRPFELHLRTAADGIVWVAVSALSAPARDAAGFRILHLLSPSGTEAETDGNPGAAARGRSCSGQLAGRHHQPGPRAPLTPREATVLRLLAEGANTAEIGRALFISPTTVRNHTQHILRKLRAHSRLQAVALARSARLI
ncbi:MAG: LuxR C-terminal-related transcriptional regulator [Deferrisomatales bacterium]|nr:LuxR C-terminal-related transcriptional regulator [Deferrisomatales bacterium]